MKLFLSIGAILIASVGLADGGVAVSNQTVGGAGYGSRSIEGEVTSHEAGGLFGYASDGLVLGTWRGEKGAKHFYILDARLLSLVGGGAFSEEGQTIKPAFRLKLIGGLTAGVQMYRVIPIAGSLEDAALDFHKGSYEGKLLLGATIHLPLLVVNEAYKHGLYLGTTVGYRYHNQLSTSAAVQPKLRYAGDRVSGEVRYLRNISNLQAVENRFVGQVSLQRILTDDDRLGVLIEYESRDYRDDSSRKDSSYIEGLVYYGLPVDF